MGEMKKTTDSCVLYGVPKIYYGREEGGLRQGTPFPMCLQSVLNYMGQNISYAELMAYSGAAFRMRRDINGWNLGAVDIRFTYENHLRPFELAIKGAGRSFTISENPDKPKSVSKPDALMLIKSELDCGRPVIALGVVGPPEACIVTGYRDNGETLLGWSLFQGDGGGVDEFSGDCQIDESGYFIKKNWWDNTEAIMSIGENIGTLTPAKEVLQNALMLMTTDKVGTYGGTSHFYGGQAAYEAWAKALEDDASFTDGANIEEIGWCQGDAETMLGEGRSFASSYMCMLAERHPTVASDLKDCAKLLAAASECVLKMWEAKGDQDLRDKQIRHALAALIRQAAKHEKEACVIIKQIIDKL
ncbi:MAG: AraC family transcriptional regulator, partial [Defluviitaleaceae bacterium]|nr:AraC family transcriptional regulator [Defluviitaleaceae bacterium]